MINNKQKLMNDILDAISKGLKESLDLEENLHPYNGNLRDIRDYESVFYSPNFELYKLNEKYHEINVSKEVLNDIINVIKDNVNNLNKNIYTNYNLKMYNDNNHKNYKVYKSSNIKLDHPIYVNLYSAESSKYGITKDRIIDDKINLNNDQIVIYINVFYINMNEFMFGILKHELTHVIEMYSAKKFNNIHGKKNTIGIDNDIELSLQPDARHMLNRMVYLFANTEHDAHINGLAGFIDELSNEQINQYIKGDGNPVYNFMHNYKDGIDSLTNYQEFEDYMNELSKYLKNNYLLPIFYIGHLLQKHHLIYNKVQINQTFIEKYQECIDGNMKNYSKYYNIAVQIVSFYDYKIKQYREDIYKIVYKKFKEKKII